MNARYLIPKEKIATHVERILLMDNCVVVNSFTLPLFANGMPTLLFITAPAAINGKNVHHLILFGQTILPENLIIQERFTLIAYFLKPYVLYSLFGIAAKDLTDYPVTLDLLQGPKAALLRERLLNAMTTSAMMALLDDYILGLAGDKKIESTMARAAASMIAHDPSTGSLSYAQKELFITERTFQREFEKCIGISPNLFRRICQFNAAFQQLNAGRFVKLSDIAFEHGYSDQSHFIRTFKEFTYITPGEYLGYSSSRD